MAVLEREAQLSAAKAANGLQRHVITRQEWQAMADACVLADQRVELIEGEIVDMAPIDETHASLTDPLATTLRAAFGSGFAVRSQVPILLGDDRVPSEPQPDVTVVVGNWRDYLTSHPKPKDVRLVVEVANSSLRTDRVVKSALYASVGIPEYWIVNLVDKCLEVHRNPAKDTYKSVTVHKVGDSVSPLYAPGAEIAVNDCLP